MKKKIKLTYALVIIGVVAVNSYIIPMWNSTAALYAIGIVNFLYLVVVSLLKLKFHNWARIVLIITPNVSTILIGYLSFKGPQLLFASKLNILTIINMPLLAIDIRERFLMAIGLAIVSLSFYFSDWIGINYVSPITNPTLDVPDAVVLMTSFWDIVIFSVSFLYAQNLTLRAEGRTLASLKNTRNLYKELLAQRKKNLEQKINSFKMKALSAQMNPHFIFNAINSIQYFIMRAEKRAAYVYLSKFARLVRRILENTDKERVPLEEELLLVKLYMDIESMRFNKKFQYSIHLAPDIDPADTYVPTMLIQPYVENSVIHGLLNKVDKGILLIDITKQDNVLTCVIEDNGVGRAKAKQILEHKNKHRSPIGMAITRERLALLNAADDSKIAVEITDLYYSNNASSGTRVKIMIPIITQDSPATLIA